MTSLPTPKPGNGLTAVVFDIDGTIAEPTWPRPHLGQPILQGIEAMLSYFDQGYEIVLHTSRPASHVPTIQEWLKTHGLAHVVYDIVTGKPRGKAYVDDRAITFPEAFGRQDSTTMLVAHKMDGHWHNHIVLRGQKPDHDQEGF